VYTADGQAYNVYCVFNADNSGFAYLSKSSLNNSRVDLNALRTSSGSVSIYFWAFNSTVNSHRTSVVTPLASAGRNASVMVNSSWVAPIPGLDPAKTGPYLYVSIDGVIDSSILSMPIALQTGEISRITFSSLKIMRLRIGKSNRASIRCAKSVSVSSWHCSLLRLSAIFALTCVFVDDGVIKCVSSQGARKMRSPAGAVLMRVSHAVQRRCVVRIFSRKIINLLLLVCNESMLSLTRNFQPTFQFAFNIFKHSLQLTRFGRIQQRILLTYHTGSWWRRPRSRREPAAAEQQQQQQRAPQQQTSSTPDTVQQMRRQFLTNERRSHQARYTPAPMQRQQLQQHQCDAPVLRTRRSITTAQLPV
jgi:hypothetical protein